MVDVTIISPNYDVVLVDSDITVSNVLSTEAIVAQIGIPGPAGSSAESVPLSLLAGESISALKAVYVDSTNGKLFLCDSSDADSSLGFIGISTNSGGVDSAILVAYNGLMEDSSWTWDISIGYHLYLAAGGAITQMAPVSGVSYVIGTVVSGTKILINPMSPIILT